MSKAEAAKLKGAATQHVKREKPAPSAEERITSSYRTLHSQLEGGFHANALKTCERILRLAPSDALALHTKTQLLMSLDQWAAALRELELTQGETTSVDKVYCLYKSGQHVQAQAALHQVDDPDARDVRLLEAQIKYRLGDYTESRDVYEDLLATVEDDSPELADLQANLDACTSRLDFISSIPSNLSHTSVETLEGIPIGPLLHSHSAYKVTPLTASTLAASSLPTAKTRATPRRLPKNFDPKTSKPADPDRWVPKRERPGFSEEVARRREMERGKKKQALMTQGAAEPAKASGGGGSMQQAGGGGSGGGGGGGGAKKKKKSGKK